jgi:hypothetical protein
MTSGLAFAKVPMSRSYTSVRRVSRSLGWIALILISLQMGAASSSHAASRPEKEGVVRGIVWNSDYSPIPNASVRLRSIRSGRIEANSVTDADGRFGFNAERGSYIVELVGDNNKVIAVGQRFQLDGGETVSTFVRVPPQRPWFAVVFSNAATAVIAAASSVGVTALGPSGHGSRPISPQ